MQESELQQVKDPQILRVNAQKNWGGGQELKKEEKERKDWEEKERNGWEVCCECSKFHS
jgi:hypothetical protein